MEVLADSAGVVARLVEGRWEDPQPSALSFLAGETDGFMESWPRSGAVRDGVAHRRSATTATLGDSRGMPGVRLARARIEAGRRNLDDAVVLWPTPCASDEKGSNRIGQTRRQLSEALLKHPVWPTPTTQDAKNDGPPSQQTRNTRPLNAMVVTRPEGSQEPGDGPRTPLLNAVFVELLMGFPLGWTDV